LRGGLKPALRKPWKEAPGLDLSKIALIGIVLLVALILSSRNIGSFWIVIYKLAVGAVAAGVCLFVLQKVNTSDEMKWFSSFVVGILVSLVASGIPWK
jgi:hypothetical protein